MHIGIAGVGKMGAAIAARLMEAGNRATVWNRSLENETARGCWRQDRRNARRSRNVVEVVITILTDAAAIDATYRGIIGPARGGPQRQALHRNRVRCSRNRKSRLRKSCAPRVRPLSNVRLGAPPGRRDKVSSSVLSVAAMLISPIQSRSSSNYAAASSIAAPSARERA